MNAMCKLAVILLAVAFTREVGHADGVGSIKCQIDGATNVFAVRGRAVHTTKDGLVLFAFTDFRGKAASLMLTIPSPRPGRFSLTTSTNLAMFYSRSIHSSSSAGSFDARSGIKGAEIEIILEKFGEVGETVEGRFSGLLANSQGERLSITNGSFSLVRSAPSAER